MSRVFIGGQPHGQAAPTWLTLLLPAPPEHGGTAWHKAPAAAHCEQKPFQASDVISQGLCKGRTYLWNVQDLNKPELLSQSFLTHIKTILSSPAMDWIWLETLLLGSYKLRFPPIISNIAVRSIPVHVLLYIHTICCGNNDRYHASEIKIWNQKYVRYVTLSKRKLWCWSLELKDYFKMQDYKISAFLKEETEFMI